MTTFLKDSTPRTPFGKNQYLRSTKDVKTRSFMFSAASMPTVEIDGTLLKVLQPGTVLAKITSGPENGKVGVFQAAGADEVHTLDPSSGAGDWASGTFTLTVLGFTTANIAFNATAATIEAAIEAAVAAGDTEGVYDDINIGVTGGPLSTNVNVVITFNGTIGVDVPATTFDGTNLADGDSTVSITTTTAGAAGATDGRQTTANIVGICDTFLPWQLLERDVEVAAVYEASVVQAWCFEYDAAGAAVALGNTTRDAIVALATLAILFPG